MERRCSSIRLSKRKPFAISLDCWNAPRRPNTQIESSSDFYFILLPITTQPNILFVHFSFHIFGEAPLYLAGALWEQNTAIEAHIVQKLFGKNDHHILCVCWVLYDSDYKSIFFLEILWWIKILQRNPGRSSFVELVIREARNSPLEVHQVSSYFGVNEAIQHGSLNERNCFFLGFINMRLLELLFAWELSH
jgi:hypothetical protein